MRERMRLTWQLIKEHFKTLLLFEVIYRVFGLAIIFPLVNQMIYLSISLQGKSYISNGYLFEYLTHPITLIIGVIILIIFGLYVVFEVVALSYFFHETYYENDINLTTLLVSSFIGTKDVIKRHHIGIIGSSLTFFVLIEGLHITGIASTVQIPVFILDYIQNQSFIGLILGLVILLILIVFFLTLFFEIFIIIENVSFKSALKSNMQVLKQHFLTIFADFLILNLLLNVVLYLAYLGLVGIVALTVLLSLNEAALFGVMLSGIYWIYAVVAFVGTIILVPINFAWINTWYYKTKESIDVDIKERIKLYSLKMPHIKRPIFKRVIIGGLIVLLGFNMYLLQKDVFDESVQIQVFNNPSIIAHRGSSYDAPENTLAAIQQAIDDGADAVEIDVRFTSDHIPVLMHDERLSRTTNDAFLRPISSVSLKDLKELDAGTWFDPAFSGERVPTLEEALILAREGNIDVYIELKASTPNIVDILVNVFETTNMSKNIKILSFNGLLLEEIKEEVNDVETVLLISSFFGNIGAFISNEMIDTYGLRYDIIMNNKGYIQAFKEAGKKIYVYTVNDRSRLLDMNTLGVDGIITDVPIIAREIVYSDTTNEVIDQILQRVFKTNE